MQSLQSIAKQLVAKGKGILAADESEKTITKKLTSFGIDPTQQNILSFRELLFTTPGIEQWIAGVILHESTVQQMIGGISVPEYLQSRGILSGVKVDQGLGEFVDTTGRISAIEKVTKGIERLDTILPEYKLRGCVFAKWRAVFAITDDLPTSLCIAANAEILANYAVTCQTFGIVPIVEPEVLMDGDHTIERCEEVTTNVLTVVFAKLNEVGVDVSGMLLKPNMVIGSTSQDDGEIAQKTLAVLQRTVPPEVPGIVFLSGGQSANEATERLTMIAKKAKNTTGPATCEAHDSFQFFREIESSQKVTVSLAQKSETSSWAPSQVSPAVPWYPWQLSFSFGRALQDEACAVWGGKEANYKKAQDVFFQRVKKVGEARDVRRVM